MTIPVFEVIQLRESGFITDKVLMERIEELSKSLTGDQAKELIQIIRDVSDESYHEGQFNLKSDVGL